MVSHKQEGKPSIPVLHSRVGSESPCPVSQKKRSKSGLLLCINRYKSSRTSRQHLKHPIFMAHVMSKNMLDCPRTSNQQHDMFTAGCLQTRQLLPSAEPGTMLQPGKWAQVRSTAGDSCCPSGPCPPPTEITLMGTHVHPADGVILWPFVPSAAMGIWAREAKGMFFCPDVND